MYLYCCLQSSLYTLTITYDYSKQEFVEYKLKHHHQG